MTVSELLTLIPVGAPALALLVGVMLFLRYLHAQDVRLNLISERCHNTQIELMHDYQENLKVTTEAYVTTTTAIGERITTLETNTATLAAAINQLVGKMK